MDAQSRSFATRSTRSAHRLNSERRSYYVRRSWFAAGGAAVCFAATFRLVSAVDLPPKPTKNDAPRTAPTTTALVAGFDDSKKDTIELVETGNATVPYFPKTVRIPSDTSTKTAVLPAGIGDNEEEYQLVGLGTRYVSFLSIKVYVVGLYIATSDLANLQKGLVRQGAEVETASTLVSNEKDALRKRLVDAQESERIWDDVLRRGDVRSVVRIVPVRNTDFAHLRDGWLRGITARSTSKNPALAQQQFDDEEFGQAITQFKQLFSGGRKSVGKGKVLMLERGSNGVLSSWIEDETAPHGFAKMGTVADERIGRLIWLGYLAGKAVASEEARASVIDGVMELVERPVGTVETQVV